jgi:uncharacterized protein
VKQFPELQFPVDFPIKIIGNNNISFRTEITMILLRHVPGIDLDNITTRESNGGKYLSISARFIAESREQMDNLYKDLSAHPDVKWIL